LSGKEESRLEIDRLLQLKSGKEQVANAAWLADGRSVALCVVPREEIVILDTIAGQVRHRPAFRPLTGGTWLAVSPKGDRLLAHVRDSAWDRTVLLWDIARGKVLQRIRLRDPATGKELDPKRRRIPGEYQEDCRGAIFSPDGKVAALRVTDESVHICDME